MKNLSLVFRSLALPVLLLTLNAAGAQEKQPLRYVDAATLTVIGKSMPTPKLFQRVDTARYELWQPVKNYSAFSTGLAVVFRTDSRTIRARWKTGGYGLGHNMTAIARKGLDLYIERDGRWRSCCGPIRIRRFSTGRGSSGCRCGKRRPVRWRRPSSSSRAARVRNGRCRPAGTVWEWACSCR